MSLPIPNPYGNVSTQKIKSQWTNNLQANTYVAPYGLMFFDTYDGVLRLGDNTTPGGQIINFGGGGNGNYGNSNVAIFLSSGTDGANIITTGNISGNYIFGNGAFLTDLNVGVVAGDQQITADGNALYSLTQNSTTNTALVSLNGIIQAPLNAYTITGNVLSFAANVTSGSLIDVRFLGTSPNSGIPGSPDQAIQFNNNGAFGGNISFTFDAANANVSLSGNLLVANVGHILQGSGITLNANSIDLSYTLEPGYNGLSAGPITIQDSAVIDVPNGQRWTIV